MEKDLLSFSNDKLSVDFIKKLGVDTSEDILDKLILLYAENNSINVRREIVSSIGRQSNKDKIYIFIKDNIYNCGIMELVYQMFRTCLYNSNDDRFLSLQREILEYFDNEILYKMKAYYDYRHTTHSKKNIDKIKYPILLEGDNTKTLKKIKDQQVQLIFSSPPYYNARDYSVYTSYKSYMNMMKQTLVECYRVLEDGRFIIINVSNLPL